MKRTLLVLILSCAFGAALSGCGLKGDLYLPENPVGQTR